LKNPANARTEKPDARNTEIRRLSAVFCEVVTEFLPWQKIISL
jgi:hypothetical protein